MISDRLSNFEQYVLLNEKIKKGFEFLKNNDLRNFKDGKYEIDGEEIFANVRTLTTKPQEEKKWEARRKYIDIQYVIKGIECMGYGILEDFREIKQEYDPKKDIEFLDTEFSQKENFNFINVKEGDFVVFFPNDVHAPMLAAKEPVEIKKVIIKIKID